MAEYYEQGLTPPTPADAAASRYGRLVVDGKLLEGEVLDEQIKTEVSRLVEGALASDGQPLDWDVLVRRALAAFGAASLVSREKALACALRLKVGFDPDRLDAETERAYSGRDYSSATATPRRDMNPALARRLGIDPHRGLKPGEVAFLLSGQRVDGGLIGGRARQSASLPLAQIFGLDPSHRPTRTELEHVLAGRRGNGEALDEKGAERAVQRFGRALGAKANLLTAEERRHILAGLAAGGRELSDRQYKVALESSKSRIGYIDLTFSAPKSVSIAWAFAPTSAERAIIHQAHNDAIDSVMHAVEQQIGRASMGRSARHGYESGVIGWVSFDHYASRPTVEVVHADEFGQPVTELHRLTGTKGRVPGDMQVHTHVVVPNIVETPSGRVGSLDFAELEGRIHEWGALYQAYLASNLRAHGVQMELDQRTEMARISAVPNDVITQFSRRTVNGTDAARAYAQSQGLDWDAMDPDRKVALLKSGVQNRREGKADDVGDLEAWRQTASSVGYEHRSVLRPDEPIPVLEREQRLEIAYRAAMPLLEKQFDRRAVLDGSEARIAAARGLIASGVEAAEDVNAIMQAFQERGIKRRGESAALIWGTVKGAQGRDRVALTTTLEVQEEKALIAIARIGMRDRTSALSQKRIDTAIASFPEIDFKSAHGREQRRIVERLGMGGRINLAIGVAGSGKSTLLKPLVRAWEGDGRIVHGIALAWRQSDELAEAGLPPRNTRAVASFLAAIQSGALCLDRQSVVVVDEIGLLGTRQLNKILTAQKKTRFQLVMLGDPKQMQSVEAGPVIELLRQAFGKIAVPELGSSVRQTDAVERETVLMFRNGQTDEAVRRKDENGTLRIVPGGYREAVEYVTALWEERSKANHNRGDYRISVSAPTNAEAHNVSLAIRDRRQRLGEVGPDKITLEATDGEGLRTYSLALAEGDRVRLFRRVNAKFSGTGTVGNIGRNGTVLQLTAVCEDGLMLRNPAGKEGFVAWSSLRGQGNGRVQLAYGDALTTNTAQGTTVTEHIHAIPGGSRLVSAFGAYTSGSRHREQSFIVTSEGAERAEIVARRPLGDRREIMRGDILNNIVRNFAQQPVKESALGMLDRAAALRQGTIKTLQVSLYAMEAHAAARKEQATFAQRFATHRINRILEERLPSLTERLRRQSAVFERIARVGAVLAERLASMAPRRATKRQTEAEYWQSMQNVGQTEKQQKAKKRGLGR